MDTKTEIRLEGARLTRATAAGALCALAVISSLAPSKAHADATSDRAAATRGRLPTEALPLETRSHDDRRLPTTTNDLVGHRSEKCRAATSAVARDARNGITQILDRLERMGPQNPENQWVRTWLDTMLELPWGEHATERDDVVEARAVLDADHEGLDKVKDRILEFLAVRTLRRQRDLGEVGGRGSGAILALRSAGRLSV